MKNMDHKKRFGILLIIVYLVSLPVITTITYFILKENAINNAYTLARLYLTTFEATRNYVGEELRPRLQSELPGKFVLEGMSRSYVALNINRRILSGLPGYIFKNASLNPLNAKNRADELETGIISEFRNKAGLKEWKGLIEKEGLRYYMLARPGSPIDASCLLCHGDAAYAPKAVTALYGTTSGYNMEVGDRNDALFAYIPVEVPLENARKVVLVFILTYTIFFGVVLYLINRRFAWFYEKIESDNNTIENISSEILNLNREMEDIVAERTMSMVGLRVADRIRNPITVIGGICRQLLKNEKDLLNSERIADAMAECLKIEKIVTDFDELVKTKRFLFKREDLNEIVLWTIPLFEQTITDRKITLSTQLHETPLMFNANRQLVKIVVRHILNNALDATPAGGAITLTTGTEDEHIVLTISDSGKGMTQEELHRMFEPFYSTKGRTGMGLALVRQIIIDHMGEITIDSKPGSGTTVRIAFPTRWREQ
jgi:signal transduction histidine kinase